MKLVVCSREDAASVNITENLLASGGWTEKGEFEGAPVKWKQGAAVVTIPVHHLFYDEIDVKAEKALGEGPSIVIFASRHKSASNMRTLTVYPIGNFNKAEMGGKDGALVPVAPHCMTHAYRELKKRGTGLQYEVSFEATHHGPFLSTPTFYIEIGSDEAAWADKEPARVIAATLDDVLFSDVPQYPVALGIGGGHYVPRISDVAREKRISFGHMLPSYILEGGLNTAHLELMLNATPDAKLVYFHRKAIKTPLLREMEKWFTAKGLRVVSSKDLE